MSPFGVSNSAVSVVPDAPPVKVMDARFAIDWMLIFVALLFLKQSLVPLSNIQPDGHDVP
jgi:hypothetical protein